MARRAVPGWRRITVSLIGTLDKFSVSEIVRRIEAFTKTGLLVVKQGRLWIEFYVREGRLMCVGPVRTNSTLGERLLQAGVISAQALQEAIQTIGSAQASEMRMALTLMDLGYIGQEELRIWASNKALEVLQVILPWSSGEIYFEENVAPPADRLLVALSFTTLLTALPTSPVSSTPLSSTLSADPSQAAQLVTSEARGARVDRRKEQPGEREQARPSHVANAPTLLETSQFFPEQKLSLESLIPNELFAPIMQNTHTLTTPATPLSPLPPVAQSFLSSITPASATPTTPATPSPIRLVPRPIDVSFMHPAMFLVPADITTLCEQNPQIQLTPDHWRVLTRVDGRTTLQTACQELQMPPEQLCWLAGQLVEVGLIRVVHPTELGIQEHASLLHEDISRRANATPALASAPTSTPAPWSRPLPVPSDVLPQYSPVLPFETHSQWGNGGNGATFVPGKGWVAPVQPLQPLQPVVMNGLMIAPLMPNYATI